MEVTSVLKNSLSFPAKLLTNLVNFIKKILARTKEGCVQNFRATQSYTKHIKSRIKADRNRRQLRRYPWYLMLGTQGAGKKTLLKKTAFHYYLPEHMGQEAVLYTDEFPDYDWWFAEEGIFIDPLTYDETADQKSWKRFMKLLKRDRKSKPVNGILLVVGLADLINMKTKQRQNFIHNVSHMIRDLHNKFKATIPVYLIFNQCDLIAGFIEFFSDLNQSELKQAMGMTFPFSMDNHQIQTLQFFEQEFSTLIRRLRERVLWTLDAERQQRGRELIHAFPQQMQLLKTPIINFLNELFGAIRYRQAMQLRGLYFTSCEQVGEPHDLLFQVMSKKFQLVQPKSQRHERVGESYFLAELFYKVILSEAAYLGDSKRSKQLRRWGYRLFKLAIPTIILAGTLGMYKGYQANVSNINKIHYALSDFRQARQTMSANDNHLNVVLPLLNPLARARALYTQHPNVTLRFLYASHTIKNSLNDALSRLLQSEYLPRIASQLEYQLGKNIKSQDLLYATLKAYLAFSANHYAGPNAIRAPMRYHWDVKRITPHTQMQLRYYLDQALKSSVAKLPLDRDLINRRRAQLENVIPSNRAYGLLQLNANVSDLPNVNLISALGSHFASLFKLRHQKMVIPALYTERGFKQLFLPHYGMIANEVAEDNQDIGIASANSEQQSQSEIRTILEKHYTNEYVSHWRDSLNQLELKPFYSMQDAINKLGLLTSQNSPLVKLLTYVDKNTHSVEYHDVKVGDQFYNFNNFGRNLGYQQHWQTVEKNIDAVKHYLTKIQTSKQPDLSAYNAIKKALANKKNPIILLSQQAKKAPQPIRRWLNNIAEQSWSVLAASAQQYLNQAWASQVLQTYDNSIRGRYPLTHSNSVITIDSFEHFFGYKGTLDQFYKKYLTVFINSQGQEFDQQGFRLGLNKQLLKAFKQAQAIRRDYFPYHNQVASLALTFKPTSLDSRIASLNLNLGERNLRYRHGPQYPLSVKWPLSVNTQRSALYMSNFGGGQAAFTNNSPWSLFKLLDRGHLRATQNPGRYRYSVNLDGYYASFSINATANLDALNLHDIKSLRLPNKIGELS